MTVPFRIAFRVEGDFVNAYFAEPKTMDGAILVASFRRVMLHDDAQTWDDWRQLVTMAFEREMTRRGFKPTEWRTHRAPEHERTGEA